MTLEQAICMGGVLACLTSACAGPAETIEEGDFRSAPDIGATVRGSGAAVSYEYWAEDDDNDAAWVEITIDDWPTGTPPVTVSDDYLEVVFVKDSAGSWEIDSATFEQPTQTICNHHQCNGNACPDLAPNCNCFAGKLGDVQTCMHNWCGGGSFTPLILDLTPA